MSVISNGGGKQRTVLVTGIYLLDQENTIEHLVEQFNASSQWHVTQRWASLGEKSPSQMVKDVTIFNLKNGLPKYVLLNKLLANGSFENYDFIIISDDDIFLPLNFLDNYLDLVVKYGFVLAQPARTHNSYIDHHFVRQLAGIGARRTRFVEIGPLVSIHKDIFPAILPFDESSSMGWGYDFVWPCIIEKTGRRMGIIDAFPIDHSIRKPVKNYNYDDANRGMQDYLSNHAHLSKNEAFKILESYA